MSTPSAWYAHVVATIRDDDVDKIVYLLTLLFYLRITDKTIDDQDLVVVQNALKTLLLQSPRGNTLSMLFCYARSKLSLQTSNPSMSCIS